MAKKFLLVFGLFMATMVCSASITPVDFQTGYEITGAVLLIIFRDYNLVV